MLYISLTVNYFLANKRNICSCIAHIAYKTWHIPLFGEIKMLYCHFYILFIYSIECASPVCGKRQGYNFDTFLHTWYFNKVRNKKKKKKTIIIFIHTVVEPVGPQTMRTWSQCRQNTRVKYILISPPCGLSRTRRFEVLHQFANWPFLSGKIFQKYWGYEWFHENNPTLTSLVVLHLQASVGKVSGFFFFCFLLKSWRPGVESHMNAERGSRWNSTLRGWGKVNEGFLIMMNKAQPVK